MAKKKKVKPKPRKKTKVRKVAKKSKVGKVRRAKAASKSVKAQKKAPEAMLEKIGEVSHYFPHVKAAAVKIMKNSLRVGDDIYIKGYTTDFKEKIASMQIDHVSVQEGKKGQEIGLLVKSRVRIGDSVYRI